MTIEKTLEERGTRYGVFADQAKIATAIKTAMRQGSSWPKLAPDQAEALDMIANKIARILNGDPNFHDSWHDIVGYTKLVADRILVRDQSWADAAVAERGEPGCPMTVKTRPEHWIKQRQPETPHPDHEISLREPYWTIWQYGDIRPRGGIEFRLLGYSTICGPIDAALLNWDELAPAREWRYA